MAVKAVLGAAVCLLLTPAQSPATPVTTLASIGARICGAQPLPAKRVCLGMQRYLARGPEYPQGWQLGQVAIATMHGAGRVPKSVRIAYVKALLTEERPYLAAKGWIGGAHAKRKCPKCGAWYDNNAWNGKMLLEAWRITGYRPALTDAIEVARFEMTGQLRSGGVRWTNLPGSHPSMTATSGAIGLAMQAYRSTRKGQFLRFARRAYSWATHHRLARSNLYVDRSSGSASEPNVDGMMVQDGHLLYAATHKPSFAAQAAATQTAIFRRFTLDVLTNKKPVYVAEMFYSTRRGALLAAYALWGRNHSVVGKFPPSGTLNVWAGIVGTNMLVVH